MCTCRASAPCRSGKTTARTGWPATPATRTDNSDVRPALHATSDRSHTRQEDPQKRHDDPQSELIRLQSLSLPFQKDGEGQPPNGGDLGIELAPQVGDHAVVAEQVA